MNIVLKRVTGFALGEDNALLKGRIYDTGLMGGFAVVKIGGT